MSQSRAATIANSQGASSGGPGSGGSHAQTAAARRTGGKTTARSWRDSPGGLGRAAGYRRSSTSSS